MGSPNFYTGTDLLNVAYEIDYALDESDYADQSEHISYLRKQMEECISSMPTLYFHKIVLNTGYHSGFQVYIDPEWINKDSYIQGFVDDWKRYKSFVSSDGYEVAPEDCPYMAKNTKNITHFSLSRAIDREYKTLHNLLLEKAVEIGMGEVVGQTWTSSVQYPITTKPYKGH